jgi:hypothetical protein
LFAMDCKWWETHGAEASKNFSGERISSGGFVHCTKVRFRHPRNSGAGAIALAAHWGASRVLMLGYDCQKTGGKAHWHGDHPKGLGNAGSVAKWPAQFQDMLRYLADVEVINCSRATALTCFPRGDLETCLAETAA